MKNLETDRRNFLKFMGASSIAAGTMTITSCATSTDKLTQNNFVKPTTKDDFILAEGLIYQTLISWGDKINKKDSFGFNNDYLEWVSKSENEILLWVNHEYVNPLFLHGENDGKKKTKYQVQLERYNVGGSIIHLKKNEKNEWNLDLNSPFNRRVSGQTKIPFNGDRAIAGKRYATGTLGNCAGGKTPWNTFLTCEENYQYFYGELTKEGNFKPSYNGWERFFKNSPLHYGWVTEVNPVTGEAKKLLGLGRFAHECATCYKPGKSVVVYSGDDKNDEHLYRFISESDKSLDEGELFVADTENGKWISMDIKKQKVLKENFKDQTEVYTFARDAAKLLGATPLDRPEDIEIHPVTGDVYICCTNNKPKGRPHGSIMKISYKGNNHYSKDFKAEVFLLGGENSGLSSPDNLIFDKNGNMWVTNDISGSSIEKGPYKGFGNNGLYFIPMNGKNAGKVFQVASAPVDAELTGPKFSPDYKTLFLSVQHPGEKTKDTKRPTSTWPTGKTPKPSVVAISGPLLDKLLG